MIPWPIRLVLMAEMAVMMFILGSVLIHNIRSHIRRSFDAPRGFRDWLGLACGAVMGLIAAALFVEMAVRS